MRLRILGTTLLFAAAAAAQDQASTGQSQRMRPPRTDRRSRILPCSSAALRRVRRPGGQQHPGEGSYAAT